MVQEKKPLNMDVLESQSAFELPDRELMLVTLIVTNVLNNLSVDIDVKNVNVALQICAVVNDVNAILVDDEGDSVAILTCQIEQTAGGGGGGHH